MGVGDVWENDQPQPFNQAAKPMPESFEKLSQLTLCKCKIDVL